MSDYVVMFRRSSKERFWTMHRVSWYEAQNFLEKLLTLTLERDLEVHIKRVS